jgi:hypothetical protein
MTRAAGGLVDIADFGDTGWLPVSLAGGISNVTGYDLVVRRIGDVVYLRGRLSGLTADTNNTITGTALDTDFRPAIPIQDLQMPTNSATGTLTIVRAWVTSAGVLSIRPDDGTTVYVNCDWLAT